MVGRRLRYKDLTVSSTPKKPNFKHQTIWMGNNLDIFRGINSGCIDLIHFGLSFNSNVDYAASIVARHQEQNSRIYGAVGYQPCMVLSQLRTR